MTQPAKDKCPTCGLPEGHGHLPVAHGLPWPHRSKCHSASVRVVSGDEGTSFYVCTNCKQPCDTYGESQATDKERIMHLEAEVKELRHLWIQNEGWLVALKGQFEGHSHNGVHGAHPIYDEATDVNQAE